MKNKTIHKWTQKTVFILVIYHEYDKTFSLLFSSYKREFLKKMAII